MISPPTTAAHQSNSFSNDGAHDTLTGPPFMSVMLLRTPLVTSHQRCGTATAAARSSIVTPMNRSMRCHDWGLVSHPEHRFAP